jgi:eukaryotic-like serine/threonine-protein kinase
VTSRAEQGPLQIGARFLDKYEIVGQVGRGGQAWVYVGTHIFTGREVAIKVIHSPYGVTQEMMVRGKSEARALGKLDHPNIVVMHDAGVTDDGLFYIVMELLRGRTFRAVLAAHGRLELEEVLRLAIQAGEAVHAAHQVQMIHRDLKPDNIYLTRDNRLKVLDFGIAKMLDEIGFTTRKDVVAGTLLYMSPEQAQGLPLTAKSDICALGLMMFEALIGKHPTLLVFERDLAERNEPYRRATLADIPPIQVNRMPPMLSELDRNIPLYVAQVVQRAIAKVAKQRFGTMADFVAAMRLCLETYLRETPSSNRRPSVRDLSVPTPKAEDALPAPQPQPAPVQPADSRASEAAAIHSQRTVDMRPPRAPEAEGGQVGQPLLGAVTAPAGTRLASQSPPAAQELAHDAPESSQPSLVTRKARPSHSMTRPQSAAAWALKPATPPPVSVSRRDVDDPPVRRGAPYKAVRNTIAAGALFGAAIGAVAAQAYFGTANHPVAAMPPAPQHVAAIGLPSAEAPAPSSAPPATVDTAPPSTEAMSSSTSLPPVAPPSAHPLVPQAHPSHALAKPTSNAKPADKTAQREIQPASGLDNSPRATRAGTAPAGEASAAKPIVVKRAIYGD